MSAGAGVSAVAAELGISKAAAASKLTFFTEFQELGLPVKTEADIRHFRERVITRSARAETSSP
jgi:hypothetical protein